MLADKVSGDLAGVWLLVAEHLRLGTWDLLCGWTGQPSERVEPRLALQCVHEAAVCTAGIRAGRLFTVAVVSSWSTACVQAPDLAVHELLAQRTVADSQRSQVVPGKFRLASGHFQGKLLARPARVVSHRRHMRRPVPSHSEEQSSSRWAARHGESGPRSEMGSRRELLAVQERCGERPNSGT
jgi:hypothetical protein